MARIRTVKPEYPKHRKVRKVSRDARLLNIHLWNLADDEGRLQELPQWIIGEVFPTDEDVTPVVLREWLGSLHDAGLIVRYEVAGEAYIQCHDFGAHQVINKPKTSLIPAVPDGYGTNTVAVREDYRPEQGTGNRAQGTGNEGEGANAPVELKLDDRRLRAEAREDFELWQKVTGHAKAKFDDSRWRCYRARRREGHDRETCQAAIRGAGTPDATRRDGTTFDEWRTIFRNTPNLEMYAGFAAKHEQPGGDFIARLNSRGKEEVAA